MIGLIILFAMLYVLEQWRKRYYAPLPTVEKRYRIVKPDFKA